MAHLPEDLLPSDFDVVIEGTGKLMTRIQSHYVLLMHAGLIQSLLAAGLARCGKSVLHLDR